MLRLLRPALVLLLLLGLSLPPAHAAEPVDLLLVLAADVSRSATAREVLGVAAIVGLQANDFHVLYPNATAALPGE